jgi:hypothetical protein
MAHPITLVWTAADAQYICATQNTAGAGNLLLNGTVYQNAQKQALNITSVPFQDVARNVSITSDEDLSAINFTVSGVLNGVPISETRAGPSATTVYTTQIFDSITSVSVNGAVGGNGVNIGSGLLGRTKYFTYNYQCTYPMLSIQVYPLAGGDEFSYSFGFTLDEVNGNLNPHHVFPVDILHDETQAGMAYCEFPVRYAFIQINTDEDAVLVSTFLQQGIT